MRHDKRKSRVLEPPGKDPESLEDHPLYPYERELMPAWREANPNLPERMIEEMVRRAAHLQETESYKLQVQGETLTTADLMTSYLLYP